MRPDWFWKRTKPSTARFVEEALAASDYTRFDLLHGYAYARWPYLYIGIGTGQHILGRLGRPLARLVSRLIPRPADPGRATFADTYHGKVVPLDAARQLVTIHEEIRIPDLEQIVPYARARAIVLKNPEHIVVLDCPCRSVRADPCRPLDVCLVVGEPFASFVAEHHPRRSRWISQDEAEAILRAEADRGHVHHAFFKDAMLGRFYAICNCCACCCGAMHAHRHGTPMLASSGYVCQVDADRCRGCELCVGYCQFGALAVHDGVSTVDAAACMGCGACARQCPEGALSLRRDPSRGQPLEIQKLIAQAVQSR